MDYKSKAIKYKLKYLNLQKEMESNKILNNMKNLSLKKNKQKGGKLGEEIIEEIVETQYFYPPLWYSSFWEELQFTYNLLQNYIKPVIITGSSEIAYTLMYLKMYDELAEFVSLKIIGREAYEIVTNLGPNDFDFNYIGDTKDPPNLPKFSSIPYNVLWERKTERNYENGSDYSLIGDLNCKIKSFDLGYTYAKKNIEKLLEEKYPCINCVYIAPIKDLKSIYEGQKNLFLDGSPQAIKNENRIYLLTKIIKKIENNKDLSRLFKFPEIVVVEEGNNLVKKLNFKNIFDLGQDEMEIEENIEENIEREENIEVDKNNYFKRKLEDNYNIPMKTLFLSPNKSINKEIIVNNSSPNFNQSGYYIKEIINTPTKEIVYMNNENQSPNISMSDNIITKEIINTPNKEVVYVKKQIITTPEKNSPYIFIEKTI